MMWDVCQCPRLYGGDGIGDEIELNEHHMVLHSYTNILLLSPIIRIHCVWCIYLHFASSIQKIRFPHFGRDMDTIVQQFVFMLYTRVQQLVLLVLGIFSFNYIVHHHRPVCLHCAYNIPTVQMNHVTCYMQKDYIEINMF